MNSGGSRKASTLPLLSTDVKRISSPRPLKCPRCRGEWKRDDIKGAGFQCPHCGAWIRLSRLHLLVAYAISLLASLVISQYLGLKVYAAPVWIPIFVVCFLVIARLTALLVSPLKVDARPSNRRAGVLAQNLRLFLSFWFGSIVFGLCYGFVLGWIVFLIGGSRQDIVISTWMWSVPLGLINPAFEVRPEKSFVVVIGIVSANCYFWALGLTLVFKVVHQFLRRNRVTELGLSGRTLDDDDED